jgi:thymidine kinase
MMFITVYKGSMFAGKTRSLIHKASRKNPKIFIKHCIDTRNVGSNELVVSHDGDQIESVRLAKLADFEIPQDIKHVFIDEGQFFDDLETFIMSNLQRDIKLYISGLNYDYTGSKFVQTTKACEYAKKVVKLRTNCLCGKLAKYTMMISHHDAHQNVNKDGNPIIVGGAELFRPACIGCFKSLATQARSDQIPK